MRIFSWNVAGLRAILKKGFIDFLQEYNPDIICLQEIKAYETQIDIDFNEFGYYSYYNSAKRPGYSGTLILSKIKPISVTYGMDKYMQDDEGRIICANFNDFYLVTVYTPNVKRELERLEYRMEWEDNFKAYLKNLNKEKPVILCGDLNVAHNEIDLKNYKSNIGNAGFTYEERDKLTKLLESGFIDTFRYFYKDKTNMYSWWSYFGKAREKNIGWRIDYFLVSDDFEKNIVDSKIHMQVQGSDHCPVELEII